MTDPHGTQLQLVTDTAAAQPDDQRKAAAEVGNALGGPNGARLPVLTRLLTAQEVGELLRVPRSTIYELARERRLPYLKVGRRTVFDPVMLAEWVATQIVTPRVRQSGRQSR